jgi:hypothetical protein
MLSPLHNKLSMACSTSGVLGPGGGGKRKTSDVFHRLVNFIDWWLLKL